MELYSVFGEVERCLNDKRYIELIEQYQNSFLDHGWKVFLNAIITYVLVTSIFMVCTSGLPNLELAYVLVIRSVLIVSVLALHHFAIDIKIVKNYIILVLWTLVNCLLIYESIPLDSPTTYEFWYLNMIMWFMISIIYCLSWKKVVLSFITQKVIVIACFNILQKKIPHYYYMVVGIKFIAYPIICIILCKLVLNLIVTVYQNKKLTETTKNILKVFPKAVIIRGSLKGEGETEDLFVNDAAQLNIIGGEKNSPKYVCAKPNSQSDDEIMDRNYKVYSEVLEMRESTLREGKKEDLSIEQILPKVSSDKSLTQNEPSYFSIKTMRVDWIDCQDAYMHVFIDNTNIK